MSALEARVATERPSPYLKQLCKHFGHKVEATFDDTSGRIAFPFGTCELDASQEGLLVLRVTPTPDGDADRCAEVVGGHLERFGRRDELAVTWAPVA